MDRVFSTVKKSCSLWLAIVITVGSLATGGGCVEVSLKRFEGATRVDASINRNWREYEQPFELQLARLRDKRNVVCEDPAVAQRVVEIIRPYEQEWTLYWGAPPESPPVVLTFHNGAEWLGTIDLYDLQMGVVGNRVHKLDCSETTEILELLCDCGEGRSTGAE